jgi:general stress protein YciG
MGDDKPKLKGGFANMSPERAHEIRSKGGQRAHELGRAHRWTSETAAAAGRRGGQTVSSRPGHMAELGRRGRAKRAQKREPHDAADLKKPEVPLNLEETTDETTS